MRNSRSSIGLLLLLFGIALFAPTPSHTSSDILQCHELEKTLTWNETKSCTGSAIKMDDHGTLDLSNATQEELDKFLVYKKRDNTEHQRDFSPSLLLRNSEIQHLKIRVIVDKDVTFTIHNNDLLEMIDLKIISANFPSISLMGNKYLKQNNIEDIKNKIKDIQHRLYFQDEGECTLKERNLQYIENFEDLKDCKYFYGDLVINGNTAGIPETLEISRIKEGCLFLQDTNVTTLEFLNKLDSTGCEDRKNEITGNKDLCLNSKQKHKLIEKLGDVQFENNCEGICTLSWALKTRNDGVKCRKIMGDLVIQNENADSDMNFLTELQELEGTLEIHDNGFEDLSFLSNLKKITNKNQAKTLHIRNNPKLKNVDLRNLKEVIAPSEIDWLVVENNDASFGFALPEINRFEKFGSVKVPVEDLEKVTNLSAVEECNVVCESIFKTHKDFCCVHHGYTKFYGCKNDGKVHEAYCIA